MEEEDIDGISVERAHRLGKQNANGDKPRPIIAKFTFHKDKELILSNARFLAGSDFGISQDFPREIVQIRKELVKVLKEAKKDGHDAKLVYDKLYIITTKGTKIQFINKHRHTFLMGNPLTRSLTSLHDKACFGWRLFPY